MAKKLSLQMPKCAPKIWKKLSADQKALWSELRNRFVEELIILNQIKKKRPLIIEGDFEITAHNLALEAVWAVARQETVEGRKPANNTQSEAIAQIAAAMEREISTVKNGTSPMNLAVVSKWVRQLLAL